MTSFSIFNIVLVLQAEKGRVGVSCKNTIGLVAGSSEMKIISVMIQIDRHTVRTAFRALTKPQDGKSNKLFLQTT